MKKSTTFLIAAAWVPMVLSGCLGAGPAPGHGDTELSVQQDEHWTRQRQRDSRPREWQGAPEPENVWALA